MQKNTAGLLSAFNRFLWTMLASLRDVRRWKHKPNMRDADRETVETHTLFQAMIMLAIIGIERQSGKHRLDETRLLGAALTHDMGEGGTGDIRYTLKAHPLFRPLLAKIERDHFEAELAHLPGAVRDIYLNCYAVESELDDKATLEGRLFNASERLGYMYVAVPQVRRGGSAFIEVLRRHHAILLDYAAEFDSVRELYAPYAEYVATVLAEAEEQEDSNVYY